MYFYVVLIETPPDITEEERKELESNCTFIKNNLWIYEGDEDFLDARFKILCDGTVGPLGGLSQGELVELCKGAFEFDESLLDERIIMEPCYDWEGYQGWLKNKEERIKTLESAMQDWLDACDKAGRPNGYRYNKFKQLLEQGQKG